MGFERTSGWQVYTGEGRRKYLNAEERARFVAAAHNAPTPVRTLCLLLIHTGCRISEALELDCDRLDVSGNTVVLRTLKRRKILFRRVHLPPRIMAELAAVLPEQGRIWPVHRSTAWRWVRRIMVASDIHGPMACCRGARHSFGVHAATHRVPPGLLQKWMGHASLQMTCHYIDAVGADERGFAERMWDESDCDPPTRG